MSITELVESPAYKKAMGYVYGWGAAVAIVGALFKIMHYPGAGVMLVAGLGVEALIFFMSAFEPPHAMPDWTLVYPELLGLDDEDPASQIGHGHGGHGAAGGEKPRRQQAVGGGGGSELAALVATGAIEQKTVDELAEGVKKLASTTSQMADLADASAATKSYINNVKVASDSVNQFAAAQAQATEVGNKLSASSSKLNESIAAQASLSEQMTTNLSAVNAAYEKQLVGLNSQLKSSETLANGLSTISSEIAASVEGVKAYREQLASLSKTVGELNSIYGNMLSAVTNR